MKQKIKGGLITLFSTLAAVCLCGIGAVNADADTVVIPGIDAHYGSFEAVQDNDGNVIGLQPSELNGVMHATVVVGQNAFGGAYGENFTATYQQVVPNAGATTGLYARAGLNAANVISIYETAQLYFRMDANACYIIANGAIAGGAQWYGDNAPTSGDVVDVAITVSESYASFVVTNNGVECMWLGGDNIAGTYKDGSYAGFACTDALGGAITEITVTNTDTNVTYKLGTPVAEPENFSDTLHKDFTAQYGTWGQTDNADVTKVTTLKNTGLCEAADARMNAGCVLGKFGGLLGENFEISYDISIPGDNGCVGFVYRYTMGNNILSIYENGGVYVRNDKGCMYVINAGSVAAQIGYSATVTEGEMVTVHISVSGTTMVLTVENASGTQLVNQTIENITAATAGEYAGFVCERANPVVKNIHVSSGENTYNAYPFDYVEEEVANEFTDTELGDKLNPNFDIMCGMMKEATDGSRLETTDVHIVYGTAGIISKFGGVYGENFDIQFDVSAPTKQETELYEGAANGFLFRASDPTNVYSGVYFRVQSDRAFVVIGPTSKLYGFVFATHRYGQLYTLKASVLGNSITVSFYDEYGEVLPFAYNGLGEMKTEMTLSNILLAHEEGQYAGFASDQSCGKFQNVVMTSGDRTFVAWPFAEGKEDISDNYKIASTNAGDTVEIADVDNANLLKIDYDIISEGFEYIIYTEYNGQAHDIKVVDNDGNAVSSDYVVTINYKKPPYTTMESWFPQTKAERHGIYVTLSDAEGYIYANIKCALRICAIELMIEDVVAVDRGYNATREIELTGGRLVGVMEGDDVSFVLGAGSVNSAKAGENKEVSTYILLSGADASNYTLVQPTLTVNIAKASQVAPVAPTLASKTENSITLLETDETEYMEFKLDDGEWQTSLVFENVSKGKHMVYARYAGDSNNEASAASEALEVTLGSGCGSVIDGIGVFVALTALGAVALCRKNKENR